MLMQASTNFAVWFIVGCFISIIVFQWKYHRINRVMHTQAIEMLTALGDAHLETYEALTKEITRLEGRVRKLEERLL